MKFEAVTIKDIAKALGLSASTVSRALRDSYEISEQTKIRIQEYAKAHNYRPNPVALSLKEKRTKSIGVVVAEIANTFFSQVIDGIESIAYNNGYNVIITQSKESCEREKLILDYLSARSVDGIIISVSTETIHYEELLDLKNKGLHIVFFDRIVDEIDTHKVTINNFKGAYEAMLHLIQEGYKNIAVIANNKNLSITKERLAGCVKSMADNGRELKESNTFYCKHGGLDFAEVENEVQALLRMKSRPDAILALSDKISIETLRVLYNNNIKVPDDIGLIGFSNSRNTELMNPPLSIIRQPAFEMGKIAATELLNLINSKKRITNFETTVLLPEIIIRKSSKKTYK